ncbi:predicted protein [Histoplasma capsulatum G186AR]|uniref:Uncharacterized protein n=1 Tax=Ajellomyces capsulatus (strain G186AR / H82 / ATCC MYA-2454 / RMSCC 2432) TaxID=447093 RepID=C0NHX5_AJECG|nr:uncharacterized protein HCBG_02947 [Histoplasma capsulatum G186AR]EEH09410.1 predicted protein [Histoplasma capsulatum G186AR]
MMDEGSQDQRVTTATRVVFGRAQQAPHWRVPEARSVQGVVSARNFWVSTATAAWPRLLLSTTLFAP